MYYRLTTIAAVFLALFLVQIASAMDMKEGLWEFTSKMEMPGMPMEMPATKHTQCLTAKDNVPQNRDMDKGRNEDCKIKNTDVKGNTVMWEMHCVSEGKQVKSIGKVTYKGDTFEGETKMEVDGMKMAQKMSGRRIGNCK
ncbi:MAG: DUF3617 family protein [Nitrospirae bacterium]|nr:DUF3617 family protein [Nitrospirota bacterium]